MTGQLTTHALDLVLGHGAAGLTVWVKRLSPNPLEIGEVDGLALREQRRGPRAQLRELLRQQPVLAA